MFAEVLQRAKQTNLSLSEVIKLWLNLGEKRRITFQFNMPPSVNALYIKRRGGQLALSEAANKYREHVKSVMRHRLAEISKFPSEDQSIMYGVFFTFYMHKLENPAWFELFEKDSVYTKDSKEKGKDGKPKHKKGEFKHRAGERKAKNRYKQVDVDNRLKFLQDSVINGLGIPDDSQIFEGYQQKIQIREGQAEYVEAVVYVVQHDHFIPAS